VPLFEVLQREDHDFLMEVYTLMRYVTYEPSSTIVDHGEPAESLLVIVSGEVDVLIDHEHHHFLDIRLQRGDFIGEYALIGEKNWGASSLLGVQGVDIEAIACSEHFVVCLQLDQLAFERIVESHTIAMKYAIHVFKQRRREHRDQFFLAAQGHRARRTIQGATSPRMKWRLISSELISSQSAPIGTQREEAKAFVTHMRRLVHWQFVAAALLEKHGLRSESQMAFADKLWRVVGSQAFTQEHEQAMTKILRSSPAPGTLRQEDWRVRQLQKHSFKADLSELEDRHANSPGPGGDGSSSTRQDPSNGQSTEPQDSSSE